MSKHVKVRACEDCGRSSSDMARCGLDCRRRLCDNCATKHVVYGCKASHEYAVAQGKGRVSA